MGRKRKQKIKGLKKKEIYKLTAKERKDLAARHKGSTIFPFGEREANQALINSYIHLADSRVYAGMPRDCNDLSYVILRKLRGFPVSTIIWGKETRNGELVENDSRQYEFRLYIERGIEDWGLCFLYVKGKANHIKSKVAYNRPLVYGGHTQEIPLIYSVLSRLTNEERFMIWQDLD